jgi:hypothetical protein
LAERATTDDDRLGAVAADRLANRLGQRLSKSLWIGN